MSDPSSGPQDELAGTEQPFVQHLIELRDRMVYALAGVGVCMVFAGLLARAVWADRPHLPYPYVHTCPPDAKLIAVGVFTPFFVPLKVLMMSGVLLALPWLMYQMWAFVAPGLYSHEKNFCIAADHLWQPAGLHWHCFCPVSLYSTRCSGSFKASHQRVWLPTPDIASYVEAILSLYLAFGMAFQVPIVVVLLVRFNLVTVEKLKDFRGYFVVLSFVIAAVVTPPDVISQLALAIPMCILYELGILGARYMRKSVPADPEDDTEAK
jgi:sec-independent protein translocase protein TatC